mgnify:FL=1
MSSSQPLLLIIDFGSQYTQLVARRVRELGVFCEIISCDVSDDVIQSYAPLGIILSGGPESVTASNTPRAPSAVFTQGCPVLGICYGMQTMVSQLGGAVESCTHREFGHATLLIDNMKSLFSQVVSVDQEAKPSTSVWMSHGDQVASLPEGFEVLAHTSTAPYAAIANHAQQFYAVQFHPEVTHTPQGKAILEYFVHTACQAEVLWTPEHIIDQSIINARKQLGQDQVVVGLSGGVDSSVVAALLHRAVGDQLTCVFVDTGLLRLNEGDEVMALFAEHLGVNVIRVDAKSEFMQGLVGVDDPEAKRKIIGETFIRVFEQQAKQLGDVKWLGQGTIYPDVIESAHSKHGKAHVIKSHHNVGGLPEKMGFQLIEPLRELFKDEVRQVGATLGLPESMMMRHPFPGPGLAVRVLGEVTDMAVNTVRAADAIFMEELHSYHLYQQVGQAFAVFLPVKTVGVKGDTRAYEYVVALRAVETTDFMTARWAHLSHDFLAHVSNRIMNEVAHVSRVVYDISGKPPATIEWE